jgi:hypothetical protein
MGPFEKLCRVMARVYGARDLMLPDNSRFLIGEDADSE